MKAEVKHGQSVIGNVGTNWHGSYPVYVADAKFEPNFRLFSFGSSDMSIPNEDLSRKLLKEEGGVISAQADQTRVRIRGWPAVATSAIMAGFVASMSTRSRGRTIATQPSHFFFFFSVAMVYNTGYRFLLREYQFSNDFERNQFYAFEEIRARRDEARVASIADLAKYQNDPVSEYRAKVWQVGRGAV